MLEKLNCKMDKKAKYIACQHITHKSPNTTPPPTTLGFGSIQCGKEYISSKLQQLLYSAVTKQQFYSWISTKPTHPLKVNLKTIHWESFIKARKESSTPMNIFMTKWISSFTACGKYMVKMKLRQDAACPCCTEPIEDLPHILCCPCSSTTSLRQELLQDLKNWFKTSKTHPHISKFIIHNLRRWFCNPTQSQNQPNHHILRYIIRSRDYTNQISIGWYNCLCGFLSNT